MRLNRFISHCGVCARRDADKLIADGLIKVNGAVVTELGTKVQPGKDVVTYKGNKLEIQRFVYILLNKPKNMITTTDDPAGRPTVLDAIESAARTRVFPVGRLDRNTTGLLLLTNDGKLTEKLTHPAHGIRKMYKVKLNKPVEETDFDKLLKGVELEDGVAKFDKIDFVEGKEQDEVGVEVTSGKNSIVRLLFEALGYEVVSLDRTMFGPLTKKRLPRGEWRLLSKEEISFLHMQ